jgi:hypothetical protein
LKGIRRERIIYMITLKQTKYRLLTTSSLLTTTFGEKNNLPASGCLIGDSSTHPLLDDSTSILEDRAHSRNPVVTITNIFSTA